jgi:hypothetical protein
MQQLNLQPVVRGEAQWKGVVMIERPNFGSRSHMPFEQVICRVMSARLIEFGGKRAINETLPYSLLSKYFEAEDGDNVLVYAEFNKGHLQFYERASFKEWVEHRYGSLPH